MKKRDFFIQALQAGSFRYKSWVIDAFSVCRPSNEKKISDPNHPPYVILHGDNGGYGYIDTTSGQLSQIVGPKTIQPLFSFKEELVIGPGDVANCDTTLVTTYGRVLINTMLLVYPFGNKIPYMNSEIKISDLESIIERRLVNDENIKPDSITIDEYMRFCEAAFALAGFSQLCVPSASERSLTTDPKIKIKRQELIEKYKDRLDDPVIQAKIGDELIAMDRAWIKGDVSEGFYIKSKSFEVVRKKMFLLQGSEQGFGIAGGLITTSLSEGWNIKDLPAMSNALRDGSYNRGAQTALGGEATKYNYRIFQNTSVSEDDCGTTLGLPYNITKDNAAYFVSYTCVEGNQQTEITDENLDKFIGKQVIVRSPAYCKTPGVNFCRVCTGKKLAETPEAISTYVASVGSTFLSLFLASMHGKSMKLVEVDFTQTIN
jgi:hypothetical protein